MLQVAGRWPVVVWSLCGYLLVRFSIEGWLWAGGVSAAASSALAIPLGLLFGLPAAVGLAFGVLAADTLRLAVSTHTVIESVSMVLIVAVGHTVWQSLAAPRLGVQSLRWWASFGLAAVCGLTTGSAFLAWGAELAGLAPFYFVFGSTWLALAAGMLVVTPPIVALAVWRRPDNQPVETAISRRLRLAVGGLPFVWGGLGSIWSLGFQLRHRVPLFAFEQVDLEVLYYWSLPELCGRGGRRLQVVFGAVVLTLLVVSLREAHGG